MSEVLVFIVYTRVTPDCQIDIAGAVLLPGQGNVWGKVWGKGLWNGLGKGSGKGSGNGPGKGLGNGSGRCLGNGSGKGLWNGLGNGLGNGSGKRFGKDLWKRFLEKVREMVWGSSLLVPYAPEGDQGVAKLSLTRFK